MSDNNTYPRIVQFLPTITFGDAIGNDVLAINDTLEKAGYTCSIFAGRTDLHLKNNEAVTIKDIKDYHNDADIIIYHVSTYWDYMPKLERLNGRKIFVYHNITPPHFFEKFGDFNKTSECNKGIWQTCSYRLVPSLCLTPSAFNKAALEEIGYLCPIHILPILTEWEKEDDKSSTENLISLYKNDGYVNILFVGRIAPNKKQQDIIDAFYFYHTFINPRSRLFIVGGEEKDSNYYQAITTYPEAIGLDSVIFTGHVSDKQKAAYYRLADVFLCMSEHEGFCVPLLEAMHYKVPIIAYESSAVTETLGGAGLLIKNKKPAVIAEAIDRIQKDAKLRDTLIANGTERLADFAEAKVKSTLLKEISAFVSYHQRKKTIFFDVTVQRSTDAGTGIQRLEKEELKCFYKEESDYKVVPFYFDGKGNGLFECETGKKISPVQGDIIYSPDLSLDDTVVNKKHLDRLYQNGKTKIWFFVHDLIPIHFPETCSEKLIPAFIKWLKIIFRYTGILGNSESTINDIKAYLSKNPNIERNPDLRFGWVWSGCDFSSRFAKSTPVKQIEDCAPDDMQTRTVRLLMVSTVEPRKMYDQAVKAFHLLWDKGLDLRLDIVGREGWKVEETVNLILGSPYLDSKLFWHKGGISDEELDSLYRQADGVIVASKWEGFGLAVTEGAYYGKPLILRDISIFREIAGDHAFYFSGYEPEDLAYAVEDWLPLFKAGKAPSSKGIHLTSWQEHSEKILKILTENNTQP